MRVLHGKIIMYIKTHLIHIFSLARIERIQKLPFKNNTDTVQDVNCQNSNNTHRYIL